MRSDRARAPAADHGSIVLILLFGVGLLLLYQHLSELYPKSSDQANSLRAGIDVAAGNWRLSGWMLTPPNFWTSDIALSAALSSLWAALGRPPASPRLLMLQPAILWTAVVVACGLIAAARHEYRPQKLAAVLLVAAVLAFPVMRETVMYFIMLSAIHIGTVLYCLLAFHAADRALGGIRPGLNLAVAFVALLLGVIGDPLAIVVGVLPVLLAAVTQDGRQASSRTALCGVALAAVALGRAALWLNQSAGGFQTPELAGEFAGFEQLAGNAAITLHAMLQLFSADFPGRTLIDALPELAHVPLLLAGLAAFALALWPASRPSARSTPLARMLALAALLDLAAVLLSNRIELEGNPIAAARYLFPAWICLALLIALRFAFDLRLVAAAAVAIAGAVIADADAYRGPGGGILRPEQAELVAALRGHGLADGVGPYWDSSILGLATFDAIRVAPGIADAEGRIVPLWQLNTRPVFPDPARTRFFVLVAKPPQTFGEREALHTFGTPGDRFAVGDYRVLIYDPAAR